MITYVLGTDLWMYPDLAESMFRDRAAQFSERLKWDVHVDRHGFERDQYDGLNPIYVILADEAGRHVGSMRLLPTTGRTMINDHFAMALADGPVRDPSIWECTRFCLSRRAEPRAAAKLFAGAGHLMEDFRITSLIAVFDRSMHRKYRVSGVAPEILGEARIEGAEILTGKWHFDSTHLRELMRRAGLDPVACEIALGVFSGLPQSLYRVG